MTRTRGHCCGRSGYGVIVVVGVGYIERSRDAKCLMAQNITTHTLRSQWSDVVVASTKHVAVSYGCAGKFFRLFLLDASSFVPFRQYELVVLRAGSAGMPKVLVQICLGSPRPLRSGFEVVSLDGRGRPG